MKKHFYILLLAAVMSISALSGCSSQSTVNSAEGTATTVLSADPLKSWTFDDSDYYTAEKADTVISLNGANAEIEGDGALLKDGVIAITAAGVYELTGSFTGYISVKTDKNSEVHLILNNADITSTDGPAIFIEQCGKIAISTAEGSVNNLSDGTKYVLADGEDEPDAALFSKDDLVINGAGTLNINGNYKDGIKCKDGLIITGSSINVTSADDGITGRDILAITDAIINIESGGDALKTTNSEENDKGELYIEGGTIKIKAQGDGLDSANTLYLNSGEITITTGEGAESAAKKFEGEFKRGDTFDMDAESEDDTTSQKGIKADNVVSISGGTIVTNTVDDSIHSNDLVHISGGNITISSGDDGVHADNSLEVSGGTMNILTSYEGLEGLTVTVTDGNISLHADDDGINASGGTADTSGTSASGSEKGSPMASSEGCKITVSGGYIYVDAAGDGVDSNDSISVTGGTLIISGPTDNGNGALDFNSSMNYDGGTLIASGSNGMLQTPDDSSKVSSITMLFSTAQSAGKAVVLTDSEGKIIAAVSPEKEYSAVTIGSEQIESGKEYKMAYGAVLSGEAKNGVYNSCEIVSSEGEVEFTVSETITYIDENGITDKPSGGGMNKGGMGRMNQNDTPPEGGKTRGERPNGENSTNTAKSGNK